MNKTTRPRMGISLADVQAVLKYEPDTGIFTWISTGKRAGGVSANGYWYITIDNIDYRANRLAWLMMTREEPSAYVDHIDGDKSNDKWENLRTATPSENNANRPRQSNNKSGFKGVVSRKGGWIATISRGGKKRYLGRFSRKEEAALAYDIAATILYGDFAHLNFAHRESAAEKISRPIHCSLPQSANDSWRGKI